MSKTLKGVILFTVIETVVLALWLVLAGVPFSGKYVALIVLAGGLFAEHFAAINVGAGRRPFGPLP